MPDQRVGTVLSIAIRTGVRGPMKEIAEARAAADGGLEGDVSSSPDRGITFLASRQWQEVTDLLGTELPWHTRRANVLVEANTLAYLIGRTIRLGGACVAIIGESKPCGLMDYLHPGLRTALSADGRGGVYGRVTTGGSFKVADTITVER